MRVSKKVQYGLMLSLYLARSGRTTLENVAKSLRLSKSFLEQVARLLRIHGVVKSTRGPSGGYELIGDPTVGDIFKALGPISLIDKKTASKLRFGNAEERALGLFISDWQESVNIWSMSKIRGINMALVDQELSLLETAKQPECGAV